MRKVKVFWSFTFVLLIVGNALATDVAEYTLTVESLSPAPAICEKTDPSPVVAQFDYDLALRNIGIDAPLDDCVWEGNDLTIWVKVHNAGYETVDCAEVAFTLNGLEFGRVHVTGLYPSEVRKYSATTVAPPHCEPYTTDAHIHWPLDENPDNNDIEDIFATGAEADTCLQHDQGSYFNVCSWLQGQEYPDFAMAAKYQMPFDGIVKYWTWWYSQSPSCPRGHVELFVWAADPQTGYPVDDGTGGLYDMEFQVDDVFWTDNGYVCYPICMPVVTGEYYLFGYSNRQGTINWFCHDEPENNPDWNWRKYYGVWYQGNPAFNGDFMVHVFLDWAGVMMTCENLTPVFCRGKNFYFKLTIDNLTGCTVSGPMAFSGYGGYDCDPGNSLVNIVRNKTYSPGITEAYYFFDVPNGAVPGQYSASISGTLAGSDLFCCMNTDMIQCSPFRTADNTEWQLVEAERPEVELPKVTELHQNYPNPFNAETNIGYNLAEAANVTLNIYDISGRLVVALFEGYQESGEHVANWDASQVSSGVYFYRLQAGDFVSTRKMNLLK